MVLEKRELIFITVFTGVLTVCINFSSIHAYHNADTLIPALASLQYWTPYYWGQERLGLLFAFLAQPIKSPLYNLLFQTQCSILCAVLSLYFMSKLFQKKMSNFSSTLLALITIVLFFSSFEQFRFFVAHPEYCQAMAFGFGGILLFDNVEGKAFLIRCGAGFLFFLIAGWINISIFILLIPMIIVFRFFECEKEAKPASPELAGKWSIRSFLRRELSRAHTWSIGAIILANAIALYGAKHSIYYQAWKYKILPLMKWPQVWELLLLETWNDYYATGLYIVILAMLGTGLFLSWKKELHVFHQNLHILFAATASSAMYTGFLGTLSWIYGNSSRSRYMIPVVIISIVAASSILMNGTQIYLKRKQIRGLIVFLCFLSLFTVIATYSIHTISGVRTVFDSPDWGHLSLIDNQLQNNRLEDVHYGLVAEEIVKYRITHCIGNYWNVWPSVFKANLLLYERGLNHRVFGITNRSQPSSQLWANESSDKMVIASIKLENSRTITRYLKQFQLYFPWKKRNFHYIAIIEKQKNKQ